MTFPVTPQALQNFEEQNGSEISEEKSKHHRTVSNPNEITTILDKYHDTSDKRNIIVVLPDDLDLDAKATTSSTQKRVLTLTTKRVTRSSRSSCTGTSTSLTIREDTELPKSISQVLNNHQHITQLQHITYEQFSGEEAQVPSCPKTQSDSIDENITAIPEQLKVPLSTFNHSDHSNQLKFSRMSLQHISEIIGNGKNEVEIEKTKGLRELIAEKVESGQNHSVQHIDDLEEIETNNNIPKVSHLKHIEIPNASNENPRLQHISELDGLHNHSAINVIEDLVVDNAPERETPETSQTQERKPWYWEPKKLTLRIGGFANRYNRARKFPQVPRTAQASEAIAESRTNMARPRLPGGTKPVNRLGKTEDNASPRRLSQTGRHHEGPLHKKQKKEQALSSNGTSDKSRYFEQEASQDQGPVRQIRTQGQYNNSDQELASPTRTRDLANNRVNEYQAVELVVHSRRAHRSRRRPVNPLSGSPDFTRADSVFRADQRINAKKIAKGPSMEDTEDPIDEDELQAPFKTTPRVVIPSNGHTYDATPRVSGLERPPRPSKSQFPKRPVLRELLVGGDSEDELSQQNAPEVLHGQQPGGSHGKKQVYDDINDGSSEDERSLETRGDIQRTEFVNRGTGSRKLQQQGNETRFGVQSLFSQGRYWYKPDMLEKCHVFLGQFGYIKLAINKQVVQEFSFKAESISGLELGNQFHKMIIHKSRDLAGINDSRVYVEFHTAQNARDFENSLGVHLKNIETKRLEGSIIDKLFHQARNILDKRIAQRPNKRSRAEEQPEDIELYASNQSRRASQDPHNLEDGTPQAKKLKLHQRMQAPSEPQNAHDRCDPIESSTFYSTPHKANGTRASLRSAGRPKAIIPPRKERSPSPERWSKVNTEWETTWSRSVVYPKSGKKTATVDKQDIRRLDDGEFLNDNLIMFYILWLEQHHPELNKRVYVHNTFFYASLTKAVRGKKGINYEAVQRWTAKVDLLSYDYIIVPVNENSHWYVAIICNAPHLLDPGPKEQSQTAENGTKIELSGETVAPDGGKSMTPSKSPQLHPKKSAGNMGETEIDSSLEDLSLINCELPKAPLDVRRSEIIPHSKGGLSNVSTGVGSSKATASESATNVIDLEELSSLSTKPNTAKSSRRPPTNTYVSKQPKIITLDSLALRHTCTCLNLRDYIFAEIKARRGVSITSSKNIGKKAKTQARDVDTGEYSSTGLPQQGNYCDCGVYLLSYLEEFFERPDGFIEDIVENKYKVVDNRNDTPAFRTKIRNILFKLEEEEIIEAAAAKKAKQAKKSKATPLKSGDKAQQSNLHIAPPSAQRINASGTLTLNVGHNQDTSPEEAGLDPKSSPHRKQQEVINIEESQENLQEKIKEQPALNGDKIVDIRVAEGKSTLAARDGKYNKETRTEAKSVPREPPVHLKIDDSFEDLEASQEITNHQAMALPKSKRKASVIDLDKDEPHNVEDQARTDSQGTGNIIGSVVGYVRKTLLSGKRDSTGPTTSKHEHSEPRSTTNLYKKSKILRSSSPEQSCSNLARWNQGRIDFDSDHRDENRVDLTEDDSETMAVDRDGFPEVRQLPPSSPMVDQQDSNKSKKKSVLCKIVLKPAVDLDGDDGDEDKNPSTFRHHKAEEFLSQGLRGRDPAEIKMLAQANIANSKY